MSQKYSLSAQDLRKWASNLLIFLAPVALLYLGTVIALINAANGVVSLADFVPTGVTVGAMVLYVLNAIEDLVRKYVSGPVPSTPSTTPSTTQ